MTVQVFLAWMLVAICGVLGYRFADRARRVFGVSPWRIPPFLWGMLCLLVPVVGNLLETVALITTRRPPAKVDFTQLQARSSWLGGRSTVGTTTATPKTPGPAADAPSTPPVVLTEAQAGERRLPGPDGWRPAEAGEQPSGYPPLFGWYADPTRRHEHRYWDGRHWSDTVSDGGERSIDPVDA